MARKDYFRGEVAEYYDKSQSRMFAKDEITPCVDILEEYAQNGTALEFAIGTGRIAIPLTERGIEVKGIDLSPSMLQKLKEKKGSRNIALALGDITTEKMEGRFSLVYLVFNTIMNLTSQEDQAACFMNAADHLLPGGYFLIETVIPDLQRLIPGEETRLFEFGPDKWGVDEYDVANQSLISHHLENRDGRLVKTSIPFRYIWPSELDLMAKLAGMKLSARWGSWKKEPFTSESRFHVSIWKKVTSRPSPETGRPEAAEIQ